MMIEKKWFDKIILLYLPVGHTHEKVDRDLFAPIGNLKKREPCEIPTKFPKYVQKAFNKSRSQPTCRSVLFVFDWKGFLAGKLRSLKYLNQFRAFQFKLDALNQPVIFVKKSALDLEWTGFEGSFNHGISVDEKIHVSGIQILKESPEGKPEFKKPEPIKADALSDLNSMLSALPKKYSLWWQNWLENQQLQGEIAPEGNFWANQTKIRLDSRFLVS